MMFPLSAELFGAGFGIFVSLVARYCPGINEWFAGLSDDEKKITMILAWLAFGAAIFASACYNWWVLVSCDKAGLMTLAEVMIAYAVANQGTHLLAPKPRKVKEIEAQK